MVVASALLTVTLLGLWLSRPGPQASSPGTAVLAVIPAPTATPIPPTPAPPTPSPTAQVVNVPPAPGNVSLGAMVQIFGTGGDGLRLRAEPGLGSEIRFLALEGEIFEVKDGPREQGGFTWWYLVAPFDEQVRGWAVVNYLAEVQNP